MLRACFMDGRDTDPKSGLGFVRQVEEKMKSGALAGTIASLIGRYYAMDRDKRWERVREAYELLVNGKGAAYSNAANAVATSYDEGVTDEFMKAHVRVDAEGIRSVAFARATRSFSSISAMIVLKN